MNDEEQIRLAKKLAAEISDRLQDEPANRQAEEAHWLNVLAMVNSRHPDCGVHQGGQ